MVILLALVLAGCGSDRRADAVDESSGQVERTESIDALNLVLVTDGTGVARLIGTLVNQADEPDRLVGLDVDAEPPGYTVIFADGPYLLPEGEPLRLYRDANVTLLSEAFVPGYRADVTLAFAGSEPLTTTVPVERNTGIYRDVEVRQPPDGDIRPGN
ncbi:hypothetical protein CFI00_00055 [Nocardioides sp. S5]|uniref:hypothetical protein n=1 Tax=Nocardioides sp. S5 TaxID=2017486 RepID=UPI001A8D4B03|nr:hypothetical protein [Nocardioides sp. S5]QSR28919.1 hypothetical protein CFI00_00055 [Nocardioides sp. S5]